MSYRFITPNFDAGDGIDNFGGATLEFFDEGTTDVKTTYSDFALSVPNPAIVTADSDGLFGDIFLDIAADVTLKGSTGVVSYGPITIYPPEDAISSLAAALVSVLDAAGNFTATDVELVLKEISDDWGKLSRINTWTAIQTYAAALQMADEELRRPLLVDYAIKNTLLVQTSGTIDLDMAVSNSFEVVLTENATITISNPPASGEYGQLVLKAQQDGGGGQFTITYPGSVTWPSGVGPVMSVANDAIDEMTLRTTDGGTIFRGSFSQAFSV